MHKKLNSLEQLMGKRLHQRRSEKSLTISDMADQLGVSPDQMEAYEQGEIRIAPQLLYEASKLLDVELIYFFEEEGTESRSTNKDLEQKIKVPLSPEEEARLLGSLSEIEDPELREKAFELFKTVKEQLN